MSKRFFPVSALAWFLAALLLQTATAQSSTRFYGELRFGAAIDSDADFEERGVTGELTYDTLFATDIAIGVHFPSGWRVEYQTSVRATDVDVRPDASGASDEDEWFVLVTLFQMVNLYYELDVGRLSGAPEKSIPLRPYIGGGLGVAHHLPDYFDSVAGSDEDTTDAHSTNFAYQAIVGLAVHFFQSLAGTVSYAYQASTDPKFNDFEAGYQSHSITAGLRYSF